MLFTSTLIKVPTVHFHTLEAYIKGRTLFLQGYPTFRTCLGWDMSNISWWWVFLRFLQQVLSAAIDLICCHYFFTKTHSRQIVVFFSVLTFAVLWLPTLIMTRLNTDHSVMDRLINVIPLSSDGKWLSACELLPSPLPVPFPPKACANKVLIDSSHSHFTLHPLLHSPFPIPPSVTMAMPEGMLGWGR